MAQFAFLVHPLEAANIYKKFPWLKALPDSAVESLFSWLPPTVLSHITGVQSDHATTDGWLINVPLTSRLMVDLPPEAALKKIIQAGKRAQQLGAKIVGLGAFTAVVGDAGVTVAKSLDVAVTTGNSYTVGIALEGTRLAAAKMGIDLEQAEVLVVGASGSIGSVCARILARQVRYLSLAGRNGQRLETLAARILRESGRAVRISADLKSALRQADVVLSVTGSFAPVIEPADLKPGAVVCDVARPRDVSVEVARLRPDVLVIEGGLVQVPGHVEFGFDFGFPSGLSYACLAETMILALEGRLENFTLGRDLAVDQIDEIMRLAKKHGFSLAGLRSFERAVDDQQVRLIRQRVHQAV